MGDSEKVFPGDLPKPKKQEKTPEDQAKADEQTKMDRYILKTFTSPEGVEVLKLLNNHYIKKLSAPVRDADGSFNASMTTFTLWEREGQKKLINDIELRMERAKKG